MHPRPPAQRFELTGPNEGGRCQHVLELEDQRGK